MKRARRYFLSGVALLMVSCGKESAPAPATPSNPAEAPAPAVPVDVTKVISQKLATTIRLPGELEPYEMVAVYPRVTAYVKSIGVDRGSRVKAGDIIARLEAPEMTAQRAESEARLRSVEAQLAAARARLAGSESTCQRLTTAAATPGVVAGNEVVQAQKTAEADRALVGAQENNVAAARQALQALNDTEAYLQVKAPFAGVVTARQVHPGALVGPAGAPGVTLPIVRIQTTRLRLVVPVPERYVAGVAEGMKVDFAIASFPGRTFQANIARISRAVDARTRTMPVELDVLNPSGELASGVFCEALWPVRRPEATLFVPVSSVATTLERVFVVRIREDKAEWVDVKTGVNLGKLTEVFGNLVEGDTVAVRGTDELRAGAAVIPRLIQPQ